MKPIDAEVLAEATRWLASTDSTDGHIMADYLAKAIVEAVEVVEVVKPPPSDAAKAQPLTIDHKRLIELAERLVASGPKAHAVSASECHEISEGLLALIEISENLRALVDQVERSRSGPPGTACDDRALGDGMRKRVPTQQLAVATMQFLENAGLLKDESYEGQKKLVRVFAMGYRAAERDFGVNIVEALD